MFLIFEGYGYSCRKGVLDLAHTCQGIDAVLKYLNSLGKYDELDTQRWLQLVHVNDNRIELLCVMDMPTGILMSYTWDNMELPMYEQNDSEELEVRSYRYPDNGDYQPFDEWVKGYMEDDSDSQV